MKYVARRTAFRVLPVKITNEKEQPFLNIQFCFCRSILFNVDYHKIATYVEIVALYTASFPYLNSSRQHRTDGRTDRQMDGHCCHKIHELPEIKRMTGGPGRMTTSTANDKHSVCPSAVTMPLLAKGKQPQEQMISASDSGPNWCLLKIHAPRKAQKFN